MAVSNIKAVFEHDIETVWEAVTSLTDYAWRSDLDRIEVITDKKFVEYTKDGYATAFTITAKEPFRRYEFDMENGSTKGHWTGIFTQNGDRTEISFTEDVTAKNPFMRPFVKGYLKKQQSRYIADLRKYLN